MKIDLCVLTKMCHWILQIYDTSKFVMISVCFFPREHQKCPWTSFFRRSSRAQFCVHGHFFRKFTGKWMRSRALFGTFSRALFVVHGQKIWKCSRALFAVHGHIFLKITKNAGICVFTGTFGRFTGTFFWKCSRALLMFTGTFLGSRARVFSKVG